MFVPLETERSNMRLHRSIESGQLEERFSQTGSFNLLDAVLKKIPGT